MLVRNFGRLMETLVREVKEDPRRLDSEEFRNILAQASEEWAEIAMEFNGGNDSSYNLCRMGKYIEFVRQLCQDPDHYAPGRQINWDLVLSDIEYVSKIVRHEFSHNTRKVSPHPRENDKPTEYHPMTQ